MSSLEKVIFLQGAGVVLRPQREEDVPTYNRWINDQEVLQYLGRYLPSQLAETHEWVAGNQKQSANEVILTIEVDGKAIGNMGIHAINWKDRVAGTGALIGEKEYWGKGYGSKAKMLMLHYAFNTLNLRKISSSVFAFNERSHAYSLKCGYQEEGILRKETFVNGQYQDQILLAVFKEDWEPLWVTFCEEHAIEPQ